MEKKSQFVIEKILTAVIVFFTIASFSVSKTSVALSSNTLIAEEQTQENTEKKNVKKEKIEDITDTDAGISNLKKTIKFIKKVSDVTKEFNLGRDNSENNNQQTSETTSITLSSKIKALPFNIARNILVGGGDDEGGQEDNSVVPIQTNDQFFYKTLIDNYGAIPTTNNLEVTMTRTQINNMTEFEYIGSDSKKISDITGIENFTNLKTLKLNKNAIQDVSKLAGLTELEVIELQSNLVSTLPDLSALSNLSILDISYNSSITSLSGIQRNTNLIKLYAGHCSISSIEHVVALSNLQELNLEHNNISGIDRIDGLTKLKVLKLSNNNSITKIEPLISLHYLEELELNYNNQITDIKKLIEKETIGDKKAKLINLKKLHIAQVNNSISKIAITDLKVLENLEDLDVSNNNLGKNGLNGIINLENIKVLSASGNGIESVEPLVTLKTKTVDGHKITEPEKTSKVESLSLQKNEIEEIETLGYLAEKLSYLDLSENHINNVIYLEGLINIQDEENNLRLQKQTANYNVKQKDVEQKMILVNMIQACKNPISKIYTEDADFEVSGNAILNTDNYVLPNGETEKYNKPGSFNIIFPENSEVGAQAFVKIKGGIANGSEYTYTITSSTGSKVYDSIVFEDYYLSRRVASDLRSQEIKLAGSIPYIINMEYPNLKSVKTLSLAGKENEKVVNVKGLESFINLETLNLSTNNISSENEISKIDMLKNLTGIKSLNLSDNQLTTANVITNYKALESLDLSNNNIPNLDAFYEWLEMLETNKVKVIPLKNLNISNNNEITDLEPLRPITSLTNLYVGKNKISNLDPIKDMLDLTVLDIGANNIEDISVLSYFTKLDSLSMGTNKIKDISYISDLSIRSLDISNNRIESLQDLKWMRSLTSLKASKNRISTIDPIKNHNNIRNDVDLNDQKIFYSLPENQTGVVEIELPRIFEESTQENGIIYTDKELRTNNCTVENGKVRIDTNELGNKVATVSIYGGNAHGTQFAIGREVSAHIIYDITELTNRDVTATIIIDGDARIVNNDGNSYTFTQNGEFTFEYENDYGLSGELKATVNWIDKQAPVIEVVADGETYTVVADGETYTHEVTLRVIDEHLGLVTLTIDGETIENWENGNQLSEDGEYVILASDQLGNTTLVNFVIRKSSGPDITGDLKINLGPYKEEKEGEKVYLTNIQPNVTIKVLKQNIEPNVTIEITDKDNKVISSESSKLATGMKIKITKGENTKEFTIVVRGDANGDSKADIKDMVKINKHRLNKSKLTGESLKASNLNGDNEVNIKDMVKINKFRLGKITQL